MQFDDIDEGTFWCQFWCQLGFDFRAFPCISMQGSYRFKPAWIQRLATFCIFVQVGAENLERILSPLRLPVPPSRRFVEVPEIKA
jgi:hypothetical protein